MERLIVFVLAGVAAQLVDGVLGMGYGVTSASVLVGAGAAPLAASAGVHLAELTTSVVSGVAHHRFGNVDWRVVRMLALPGAGGAAVGALTLGALPATVTRPWVAAALTALGLVILVRAASARRARRWSGGAAPSRRALTAVGLAGGFLDAAGGGGWGPVATPALLSTARLSPRRVVGTVSATEFAVAAGATIGFAPHLLGGDVALGPTAALLAGGVVAAPVAAWLVRHVRARSLASSVGVAVVAVNAATLRAALDPPVAVVVVGTAAVGGLWIRALAQGRRSATDHGDEVAVAT